MRVPIAALALFVALTTAGARVLCDDVCALPLGRHLFLGGTEVRRIAIGTAPSGFLEIDGVPLIRNAAQSIGAESAPGGAALPDDVVLRYARVPYVSERVLAGDSPGEAAKACMLLENALLDSLNSVGAGSRIDVAALSAVVGLGMYSEFVRSVAERGDALVIEFSSMPGVPLLVDPRRFAWQPLTPREQEEKLARELEKYCASEFVDTEVYIVDSFGNAVYMRGDAARDALEQIRATRETSQAVPGPCSDNFIKEFAR
ncbi:MAG: hypothetical protein IH621_11465 [Krumholzibacteria bacterium]|nr:hypothetical protein [Candidatus Krumholzibacteria bacterium]